AYNNPHILDVDLSIEGVENPDEVSPGGFVAKDGLKRIFLNYTGVNLPTKTRLNWDSAKIKVDGLPDGTDEIYWDPASMMPTQLWVRGLAASDTGPEGTNGGPEHLCLEAINNGAPYLYDRVAFTVYEVTNIIVIPKGMTTNDTLPDPVTIGAGAMDSEAHQADVTIQITPPISGVPVDVSLLDGRGHDAGKDAKLVMGGAATAIGGGAAVTVLTGAGGQIQGVLTSSDVEDGLACKIHAGLIDRPVQFTWDRYPEAAQWTNVQEYLPFPGVLTNYVVLRHHRKPDACTPTNPAPYRPFIDHEIHFFVEQVEYWDTNGVLCVTNNTPPVSGGLSAFAAFVQEAYTTDGGGQVVPLLQVYTNYDISSVTMVAYDYSVWDTAAVSGAGAGGSGGTAGSLQEGGGGSGGLTPQQASPTAGHSSISSTDDVPKVEIEKCASAFLPQGGDNDNTTTIRAFVTPSTAKGKFQFTLFGVSDEKGYCLNAPTNPPASGEDSDAWKDYQFPTQTGFRISGSDSNIAATVANDLHEATVTIKSFDYGSFGKIKAEFTTQDGSLTCVAKEVGGTSEWTPLPADTNGNHIADAWAYDAGAATDDTDTSLNNTHNGDGLTRYEEYRGVDIDNDGEISANERLRPDRKDLFVRGVNFDADHPFAYGNAFAEAQIEVHNFIGVLPGKDRNIDVMIVTNNPGAYPGTDGHINKKSGVRNWTWDTKGASTVGGAAAYGKPQAYQLATDCYFTDSPYDDSNTNGVLDYITVAGVEDVNDNGILDANENDGVGGAPPVDDSDGVIDGDHVVIAGASFDWGQELSADDIDDDGLVELPTYKSTPVNAADEYTKAQVLLHSITHEMGHATGINGAFGGHCNDSTCLMYQYSNNWKRDGHFCNDCRGMILIHNN
ncbi:MAG: hypothetical protein WCS01_11485, partial [bacterium]